MSKPVDARRRWFGVFFLIVAAGMLIWGETVFKPYLIGIGFVIYWILCFVCTGLAMAMALLDIRAVRRRTRERYHDLFRNTVDRIDAEKTDKPERLHTETDGSGRGE